MKTKKERNYNPSSLIRNQCGSSLLSMLFLSCLMAAAVASIMLGSQARVKVQAHAQAREDGVNLETMIRMQFTSHSVCKANLNSNSFGNTIDELKNLSARREIKAFHPGLGSAPEVLAGAGALVGRARVTGVYFTHLSQLDASTSYIADMNVALVDPHGVALREISIPFYFTTDMAGAIIDCTATSYPQGRPLYADQSAALLASSPPRMTIEDIICQESKGATTYYSPTAYSCVATAMIGAR